MVSRGAAWLLLTSLLGSGCAGARKTPVVSLEENAKLLPARTRRLSNWELERSVAELLGTPVNLAPELPPDIRQEGYTRNVAQDVSSTWASRYSALVAAAAADATPNLPCSDFTDGACREESVRALGLRAFRRPLTTEEVTELGALPTLPVLLRSLLESPSFLYVTELGEGVAPRTRLSDFELASELSYLLRGAPPDSELLQAAAAGKLSQSVERLRQAHRLLALPDTRYQFRRFALEWLEVDGLLDTAKNSQLFPNYDVLKPYMLAETENYVDEVMVHGGASVQSLIAGGFAAVGPEMAQFYGLSTYGARASLRGTGRLGVLQQASFLAAHAHPDVTSPVKRGDFVLRKLLCEKLKRPAEIGLEVVMPPPSATLSNRERLSLHISDPGCASCHSTLDPIGFTFEGFDASGGAQTVDHGRAIDTKGRVRLGAAATETFAVSSSAQLTQALLKNPTISECFARHAFRYFSAQADPGVEASFLALRAQLDDEQRDNLFQVLLAYIASDLFVLREVPSE